MRLRREYVIVAVALLVLGGGSFAVWKFYFKAQVDQYKEDVERLEKLKAKLEELKSEFGNQKPEDILTQYTQLVQPWSEALEQRAKFFSVDSFVKLEAAPENTVLRQFYAEQFQKIILDVNTVAYNKNVQIAMVNLTFGQPQPDSLRGRSVNAMEVLYWLTNLQLGAGMVKKLLDNNAALIETVEMWEPRPSAEVLQVRTFGVAMWIQMKDLIAMYQNLNENRDVYYSIPGIRITNAQLRSAVDPYLRVEMLIDIAAFQKDVTVAVAPKPGQTIGGGNALSGMRGENARNMRGESQGRGFWGFLESLWPI